MSTRLNKSRYQVVGWRRRDSWRGSQYGTVTIDVSDLLEKQQSFVWRDGAYKVTLKDVPDMRTKTFYGETAWSDAACYASDAATKCGDWRWHPDI